MSGRCICDRTPEAGPSTHRGVQHLSRCSHSDLKKTTRRYRPVKIKHVPGSRRLIAVEIEQPKRPRKP